MPLLGTWFSAVCVCVLVPLCMPINNAMGVVSICCLCVCSGDHVCELHAGGSVDASATNIL